MTKTIGTFRLEDLTPLQRKRYQKLLRYRKNAKRAAISPELFRWIEDAYVQQENGNSTDFLLGEALPVLLTDLYLLRR